MVLEYNTYSTDRILQNSMRKAICLVTVPVSGLWMQEEEEEEEEEEEKKHRERERELSHARFFVLSELPKKMVVRREPGQ